ncbi:MAG TPA: energy transducer TonB [Hyphomicrobium sp.]|nr:energy transducer TonB [Hyphomicrobium sp.]
MTAPRPIHHADGEALQRRALRWSLAGLCIVMLHGGLIYAALNWPRPAEAAAELPAAIMIELAPVPVAPDTPPQDLALGPQMEQSQEAAPSEQEEKPVEEQKPEPEVKPEIKTEIEIPLLPDKSKAEAVLAQMTPPEPQKDKPKEEKKKPDKPKKSQKKPQDRKARNAPDTAAPQAANVQRSATNAAPMAGTSSSTSPVTWRSMIMALLNRNKRMPPGGGRGTATVAFTIDRSGRVLSARLAGSSGDAALDAEAVSLARRVSPVPAPPANIGGGSVLLAVPVRFGG